MNPASEIAYRLDPALWMREVLGITPHALAEDISARTAGRIHCRPDRAAGWQNHRRRGGNGPFCRVHAGVAVGGCLSHAKPKRRSAPQGARMVLKAGAELTTDNVYKLELANGSRVLALPGTRGVNPRSNCRCLDRCR